MINMDIKEQLYKPFNNIQSRKGRGGTYDYVSWKDIADRMNDVFGFHWSSNVLSQELIGENIVIRVNVCVQDPETSQTYCQEGFGGAVLRTSDEPGSAHKGAYSKALKDACKKWGVALHLEEDIVPSSTNIPDGFVGYATGVPTDAPKTWAPPTAIQDTNIKPQTTFAPPSSVVEQMVPKQADLYPEPTMPVETSKVEFTMPTPPMSAPNSGMGLPPTPSPAGINKNVQPTYQPPVMPTVPTIDTSAAELTPDMPGSITNVQEMAVKNLSKLKGYTDDTIDVFLKDLVNNPSCGLNRQCPVKDLSYNEAVCVIKTTKNLQ